MASMEIVVVVGVDDDEDVVHQSKQIDVADAYQTFRMDRKTWNSSWNSFGASNAYDV